MDNIDKRIKQIDKQIHKQLTKMSKIKKKNNDMFCLETVNYARDAIDASAIEGDISYYFDGFGGFVYCIKKGFLKPFSLIYTISDVIENLAEFGAYAAIPIALLGILFVPCAFIDIALTPVCWFHNFVTMLPGHLLVNAIIKHINNRDNKWAKKLPEVEKVINNLKQEKENLLAQKENKIGKEDKKENVVVEKELKQKEKSTTDFERMSGKEIAEHIVKSRIAKQSNSKKADSEMEM